MPVEAQFTVDPALTAIVRQYKNPAWSLIHREVLPEVRVPGRTFKYSYYPYGDAYTVPDTRVGRRSSPNRVELQGRQETGRVEDYGIDIPLDRDTIEEAMRAGFDPRSKAAERAEGIIQLDREQRTAAFVQSEENYYLANTETLAAVDRFDPDAKDSDPIGLLSKLLNRPLVRPNQIVMGQAVWSRLRQHPHLVSARNATSGVRGMITREEFAEMFEIEWVLIGSPIADRWFWSVARRRARSGG